MPSVDYMKDNNDDGDFQDNKQEPQDISLGTTSLGTTDKLRMEMCDLQKTKIRSKADDCKKPVEDNEDKKDWKLAAAVFDRILLIIFTILHVGGTVIFFIIFIVHYFN